MERQDLPCAYLQVINVCEDGVNTVHAHLQLPSSAMSARTASSMQLMLCHMLHLSACARHYDALTHDTPVHDAPTHDRPTHDISTQFTPSIPEGWTLQLCMHRMQGQRWQYQQPFHQPVEQIPSSTTRLTHLNFQQELLRDASPLLVQVTS